MSKILEFLQGFLTCSCLVDAFSALNAAHSDHIYLFSNTLQLEDMLRAASFVPWRQRVCIFYEARNLTPSLAGFYCIKSTSPPTWRIDLSLNELLKYLEISAYSPGCFNLFVSRFLLTSHHSTLFLSSSSLLIAGYTAEFYVQTIVIRSPISCFLGGSV